MATLLRPHVKAHAEEPAIIDEHTVVNWAELDDRVNRCIDALRHRGLTQGDTVVLMGGNHHATYEVTLAAMHAGWIVVPVNWHWVADELAYVLEDCGADAFVVADEWATIGVVAVPDSVRVRIAVSDNAPDGFESYEQVLAAASPDEPADQSMGGPMFYTSGTTGFPKGVRSALASTGNDTSLWPLIVDGFAQMMQVPASDIVQLVCGPAYHSAQWVFGMVPLAQGGTLVLQHRFDAAGVLGLIDEHHVTGVHLVPAQMRRMLDLPDEVRNSFDGSSLVAVFHGAAPCPIELKRAMIDWWGPVIWEYYGGTEGGFLSAISATDWLARPGSVGQILSTVEVVALGDDGNPLGPGEDGELAFRSRLGTDFSYHNAPEKTEGAHRGDGFGTLGDVGHLDTDGFLFITDRRIDMVISGGVNIYPAEIEAVLADHPTVRDVAVIGVADDAMGESVCAIVETAAGTNRDDALVETLSAFCREHLAGYKVPRRWEFTDSLERNAVGKLDKKHLRTVYATPTN